MTLALAHLAVRNGTSAVSDFTISMWDSSSEAQNHLLRAYLFVLKNWWHSYTGKRGDLLDIHSDALVANYHPGTGILAVVDVKGGRGFYWKSDASPIPYYETCSPFRSLLHSWMRNRASFFVHGATIGTADGGVLLVGKGGSGKSTTTLSCLRAGLQVAGDDYCVVSHSSSGYTAHSLYNTAKLVETGDHMAFGDLALPWLNPVREPGEKVALSLAAYTGAGLVRQLSVRAILVPVIVPEVDSSIMPCSAKDALLALAPNTLSQLPASGAADLRFLAALTRTLPCFRIALGSDRTRPPMVIRGLLADLHANKSNQESLSAEPHVTA